MSVHILKNFKVDDEWVCAIQIRNEHTGHQAGSSVTPEAARLLAAALNRQADQAEKGQES